MAGSASFSRLFDRDPLLGTKTYYHYDATTDKVTFETRMDVEDLLEVNKAQYNLVNERSPFGNKIGPNTTVARLPLHVWWDLKRQGIADDRKRFKAWLNDSANGGWRTRPGRV